MKYLKIHIQKNGTQMVYPPGYQSEIGDFAVDHLYYVEGTDDKLLLCIPDKDFKNSMVRNNVEEVTETNANLISTTNEQKIETITDEAKVRRLEIKSRLGIALTKDEEKALDPTDPTPGFGITEILADRIKKHKANEK